jgi:hypothetical protein
VSRRRVDPIAAHRRTGPGGLTPEQLSLAEDLHVRALALRAASEDGLSIREAVELAAVQLGLEGPATPAGEVSDDE